MIEDVQGDEIRRAIETAGATCRAHGHRLGPDGREPVLVDGELWCRQCARFYREGSR